MFAWERDDFNVRPCLNPPPVAGAAATDPRFVVTERFGSTSESPTITFAHPDPASTATIRVRGDNWFVVRRPDGTEFQTLRLNTTDWQGRNNVVWLERTAAGYIFRGARAAADGTFDLDPDDCGQCWAGEELRYVGPDGHQRSARIALFEPPTGQPTYSADAFIPRSPVTFDANDFRPAGAVGRVSYTWQFQGNCGAFSCTHLGGPFFEVMPDYGDPVPGAVVSHAWPQSGSYHARVEATDSEGRKAAHEFVVWINTVAPTVTLARDCALQAAAVACNNSPTTAGAKSILVGGASRFTTLDRLEVRIDWGDGTGSFQQAGAGRDPAGRESDLHRAEARGRARPRLRAEGHAHLPRARLLHGHGRGQEPGRRLGDHVDGADHQGSAADLLRAAGRPALRRRAGRSGHRQRLRPARHLHRRSRRRLQGRRTVRLPDPVRRRGRVHRHRPPGRRQRDLDRRRPGVAHLRGAAGALDDHRRRRVQDLRRPRPRAHRQLRRARQRRHQVRHRRAGADRPAGEHRGRQLRHRRLGRRQLPLRHQLRRRH